MTAPDTSPQTDLAKVLAWTAQGGGAFPVSASPVAPTRPASIRLDASLSAPAAAPASKPKPQAKAAAPPIRRTAPAPAPRANVGDPLPANLDAEKTILGAILLDNAAHSEAAEALKSDDFSLDSHRRIFLRMTELIEMGRTVDIVTLANELARHKEVQFIGGVAYLASLTEGLPRRPVIADYIRIVKDKSLLRRIMGICSAAIAKAADQSEDAIGVLEKIEAPLLEIRKSIGGASTTWRSLFHTYDEFLNAPPLVFAIGGIVQEQGVTLIGGLAGHAKTLFMLDMVSAMLNGYWLFDHFAVPRLSNKVLYLVPESSIGPFWTRLKLFRLEDHVRADRLLVRTLSSQEQIEGLSDPRILKAAEGADIYLDTAVRFMAGTENDVEPSRIFAASLFSLLAAGARSIIGAHHSPKSFETQDRMTLEGVLRGSGDIGAMLATAWGVRQIDPRSNRVFVANLKARDFEPCEPFIIEGRPHLDEGGHFKLVAKPGEAGELRDHLQARAGKRASAGKEEKIAQAYQLRAQGKNFEQIASAVGVAKGTISKWLKSHDSAPEGTL
jgi:hypothetical protein